MVILMYGFRISILALKMLRQLMVRRSFWMMWPVRQRIMESLKNQGSLEENMSNFSVSTVPADCLTTLGAKASAGITITKFLP